MSVTEQDRRLINDLYGAGLSHFAYELEKGRATRDQTLAKLRTVIPVYKPDARKKIHDLLEKWK